MDRPFNKVMKPWAKKHVRVAFTTEMRRFIKDGLAQGATVETMTAFIHDAVAENIAIRVRDMAPRRNNVTEFPNKE